VYGVACKLAVAGDQGEFLDRRLSNEHTIERFVMVERESPDLLHVLWRQRQKGKTRCLDRGPKRRCQSDGRDFLLDTHAAIWWMDASTKLPAACCRAVRRQLRRQLRLMPSAILAARNKKGPPGRRPPQT
jgi:hypothetical protein